MFVQAFGCNMPWMKPALIFILLTILPAILWAQFMVEPQAETLKNAKVKCVTVFEGVPNAAPFKVRNTCYFTPGKVLFDSVFKLPQPYHSDTLKDNQHRPNFIKHYKHDTLLYTENFVYETNSTHYNKRFIVKGKQMILVDSAVYNQHNQLIFKHLLDSGIRITYLYDSSHHQLIFNRTETNNHQLLSTDSLVYDSLGRLIERHTNNRISHQLTVFKRTYTSQGLPSRDAYLVNGKQTESVQYTYNNNQQLTNQVLIKPDKSMIRYRYTYLANGLPEVCYKEERSPKVAGGFQLTFRKMFRYTYF